MEVPGVKGGSAICKSCTICTVVLLWSLCTLKVVDVDDPPFPFTDPVLYIWGALTAWITAVKSS